MRTLTRWSRYLTALPSTIECPGMRLIANDHDPPVFVGPGHIDIKSTTVIEFTMFATAGGGRSGSARLPHPPAPQFRLFATDYEGNEWACGWTSPSVKGLPRTADVALVGKLSSLSTLASEPWVASESGVELVLPKVLLPMGEQLVSVSSIAGEEVLRSFSPGRQTVRVLDSEITFFYTPSDETLWVTARTSEALRHPYAENWLSEPLRILLGQLIYPRLVARNFGDGKAFVTLRASPPRLRETGIASLLAEDVLRDRFTTG